MSASARRAASAAAAWLLAALLAGGLAAAGEEPARVEDVVVERQARAVTIHVRTSGPLRFTSTLIDGPPRLVLDFAGALYAWRPAPVAVDRPPLRAIRGSQFRKDVARLVVEFTERVDYRVEHEPTGLRIVVGDRASGGGPAGEGGAPAERRPAEPEAAARPGPARRAAGPATSLPRLQGVVIHDDEAIAYIEDPATRQVRGYRRGDALAGGTIQAISEDTVIVRRAEDELELRIAPMPAPGQSGAGRSDAPIR